MGSHYKILLKVAGEEEVTLQIPNGFGTEFVDNPDGTVSEIKHQEYFDLVSGKEITKYLDEEAVRYILLFPYEALNKDHSFYLTPTA